MLVTSFLTLSNNVFKSVFAEGHLEFMLCGKGLTIEKGHVFSKLGEIISLIFFFK